MGTIYKFSRLKHNDGGLYDPLQSLKEKIKNKPRRDGYRSIRSYNCRASKRILSLTLLVYLMYVLLYYHHLQRECREVDRRRRSRRREFFPYRKVFSCIHNRENTATGPRKRYWLDLWTYIISTLLFS